MPPSFEKPEASKAKLDEAEFDAAYLATQAKYPKFSISKNSARPFLEELLKRNEESQKNDETDYFQRNVNQTLRQFSDARNAAKFYSSLAGHYFGGHRRKAEEHQGEPEQDEYSKGVIGEARRAEIMHEHGVENVEKVIDENK